MKQNLTELVYILDRSGSMDKLAKETISGYNSMITAQKELEGEANVTTVLFDDQYEVVCDRINIQDVKRMTSKTYFPRGYTSLLDAIGKTIISIGQKLAELDESERPSKVLFTIITDGQENTSKEFIYSQIKEMIEHQTEKYSWEFFFVGANIDVMEESLKLGIASNRQASYVATPDGVKSVYSTMSKTMCMARSTGVILDDWSAEIKTE